MTDYKSIVAQEAVQYCLNHKIIGVGSGSTVNALIEALAPHRAQFEGCVAASVATENLLKEHGFPIMSLSAAGMLSIYLDGADEVSPLRECIKGRGAALAREKVIATAAKQWVCLVDESKMVGRLGRGPVPVEVLPMARSFVAREIVKLGGDPVYREGVVTDNHNCILDVYHLDILQPIAMEEMIKLIPGVVENGLFAKRCPDVVLVAGPKGIQTIRR